MGKIVATGDITSWGSAGSLEYHLINAGISPYTYTLTQTTGTADSTEFNSSGVVATSMTAGLRSWAGSLAGRYRLGASMSGTTAAVVTFTGSNSNAYTANIYGYSLSMTAPAYDSTALSTSGVIDSEYTPGLWSWSLTMQAWLDDAAALPNTDDATSLVSTAAAIDLKLSEEGATDNTIQGGGIISGYEWGHTIGSLATANITFTGSGVLTGVGASTNIIPAGAIVRPTAETLLVRMSNGTSDLESTGSAFLTSLNLNVAGPGALVDVSGTFQGTGALTNALTAD
jgi:hypothetical protein